jgi:hypothetical protein
LLVKVRQARGSGTGMEVAYHKGMIISPNIIIRGRNLPWNMVGNVLPIASPSTTGTSKCTPVGKALLPFPPPLDFSVRSYQITSRKRNLHLVDKKAVK